MNQPPDGTYDGPTENSPLPPQWQQGQYPQQVSSPNYPPYPLNAGPVSQPGFSSPPQGYSQQGAVPNYPGQPGPGYPGQPQQGFPPQQPGPYGGPSAWPNMAQPPRAPKKTNMALIITSIILVLVLLIGGGATFAFVRSQPAKNVTPVAVLSTPTANVTV